MYALFRVQQEVHFTELQQVTRLLIPQSVAVAVHGKGLVHAF